MGTARAAAVFSQPNPTQRAPPWAPINECCCCATATGVAQQQHKGHAKAVPTFSHNTLPFAPTGPFAPARRAPYIQASNREPGSRMEEVAQEADAAMKEAPAPSARRRRRIAPCEYEGNRHERRRAVSAQGDSTGRLCWRRLRCAQQRLVHALRAGQRVDVAVWLLDLHRVEQVIVRMAQPTFERSLSPSQTTLPMGRQALPTTGRRNRAERKAAAAGVFQ